MFELEIMKAKKKIKRPRVVLYYCFPPIERLTERLIKHKIIVIEEPKPTLH